ncbi:hypothetical protein F4677DRAFT_288076 [Hypoxylon crocopeplum]|nr:hypothetical protein F4677DRAFT_288076 [Hypoxylon crocopeplum]
MPHRFPFDEAPDPSARQIMEDALHIMHGGPPPFEWIGEDGTSMLGCYGPLCYSPLMAQKFFEWAKAAYGSKIMKPRNRELAILGLASILDVPYVIHTHRSVAFRTGITPEQYDDAVAGRLPQGLSGEECMAYNLGRILTNLTGPLDDETWEDVTSKMNKAEVVEIIHIIAGYRCVALMEQVNGKGSRWMS